MSFAFLIQAPALLKIVAFFLVWLGAWLPLALPLAIALKWRPSIPPTPAQKLPLVASLYLLAPLILWGAAWIEAKPFSAYGLAWQLPVLPSLGIGLVLGAVGLVILLAIERLLGWLEWQPASWAQLSSTLLMTLPLGLWISVTEELIFRGFLLNQLQPDFNAAIAAAGSSIIFALLHLVWEGRAGLPSLPGLWLIGMVLVLARWVDGGSLGLACGLHAGWIWVMASLDAAGKITYPDRVPEWVTGVAGKPLAGGMGILFLLVTGVMVWQLSPELSLR